jgi:hypothetical protein
MGYESTAERQKYQQCDNCIFIKSCFLQELQREQEKAGQGNDCLMYQDERDLLPAQRTVRYKNVVDLPPYTVRLRKPG